MSRRAFTLLEMVLAATIGTMVALTALSLFSAIQSTEKHLDRRFKADIGLGLVRLAMTRASEQLLVSDAPRPTELDDPKHQDDLLRDGGASLADEQPRVLLEEDLSQPAAMAWRPDPNGPAMYVRPQRLELTLRWPPVHTALTGQDQLSLDSNQAVADMVESMRKADEANQAAADNSGSTNTPATTSQGAGSSSASSSGDAGSDKSTNSDSASSGSTSTDSASDTPAVATDPADQKIAQGVHGVFELTRAEDPADGWTLWWRLLGPADPSNPTGARAADASADGRPDRVQLATGIKTCRWTFRRDKESLDHIAIVWAKDLPAYIELEIETMRGRWNKWMFEVGWTEGPMPGSVVPAGGTSTTRGTTRTPTRTATPGASDPNTLTPATGRKW